MPGKLPSEIRKVALDAATFRGTGAFFEPTYVNFIFGSNGTGKSTIAKALLSGEGLTYAPGKTREDYNILVYNQAFIDTNVRSYHNLPGVFTINDINVRIQEQIDEKEAQQTEARRIASAAAAEKAKKTDERSGLLEQLQKDCWKKTEDLRSEFEKTQEGKKKGRQFVDEVRAHPPIEHDLDHLRLMYASAYSESAKRYTPFHTVEDIQMLDGIEGSEILEVVIANAAETGLTSFLEEIGATAWFRQGHAEYHDKTNGRCPYCTQPLPVDFNKTVTDSFDNRYEVNLGKLNSFYSSYREIANRQFMYLSQIPAEIYPAIDTKPYNDKINAVEQINKAIEQANKENKYVLCQVGGNWCPWCLIFAELATTNKEIKDIIDKNFVYIHVNYSKENKNPEAMRLLRNPARFGFPVFVILDNEGNYLHTQNSSYLEEGKGYDVKKVVDFLSKWTKKSLNTLK